MLNNGSGAEIGTSQGQTLPQSLLEKFLLWRMVMSLAVWDRDQLLSPFVGVVGKSAHFTALAPQTLGVSPAVHLAGGTRVFPSGPP